MAAASRECSRRTVRFSESTLAERRVAVGMVDRDGKILAQGRKPMVANGTAEAGLQAVFEAIDSMMASEPGGIQSIGICAPGTARSKDRRRSESSESSLLAEFPAGRESCCEVSACPSKSTTTPMPPPSRKLAGARRAAFITFSTPRSELASEAASSSTTRSITARLDRRAKAGT